MIHRKLQVLVSLTWVLCRLPVCNPGVGFLVYLGYLYQMWYPEELDEPIGGNVFLLLSGWMVATNLIGLANKNAIRKKIK